MLFHLNMKGNKYIIIIISGRSQEKLSLAAEGAGEAVGGLPQRLVEGDSQQLREDAQASEVWFCGQGEDRPSEVGVEKLCMV